MEKQDKNSKPESKQMDEEEIMQGWKFESLCQEFSLIEDNFIKNKLSFFQ